MTETRSAAFAVNQLRAQLQSARDEGGAGSPVISRMLRTVMRSAGYRVVTQRLRQGLAKAFQAAGLHVNPDVLEPTTAPTDYLSIGLKPIPPEVILFAKEKYLSRFIESSLGTGTLSRLSLYKDSKGRSGREFSIRGKFVDLLCREALTPSTWGLVAIQIKREEAPKGTLTQMCDYLELLSAAFPDKQVRGIIVSSSEEAIDKRVLGEAPARFKVDWYRYTVSIEKVGSTS